MAASMTTDHPFAPPAFGATELDQLVEFVSTWGFGILRGMYDEAQLDDLQEAMADAQQQLLAGELPPECGTVILDSPDAIIDGRPFAHYVCHITEVSTLAHDLVTVDPIPDLMRHFLGPNGWLLDDERFGVVYQDARPAHVDGDQSGYQRIGWHSDFQSGPHLDMWPSMAFTLHLDATSPANGFLRVVPGSHRHSADGMPLGFERIAGEIAVYAERGDLLFHDAHLWHAAARATDTGEAAVRRHLRGGWYGGTRLEPGHGVEDFVKNAAR